MHPPVRPTDPHIIRRNTLATARRARRRRRRLAALAVAGLAFTASACRNATPPAGAPTPEGPAALVEALPARQGNLPLYHRVSGVVRARSQVEIRPEITAVLAEVLVESGDAVEKGQPLLRLEPEMHRQALRQGEAGVQLALAEAAAARARVSELQAQATRTRKLAEQAIVSALERETLEAQLAAAQASVRQAAARASEARAALGARQSTYDKTVVRSPIAGRVGRRQHEVGMLVTPATVLFVVGDLERVTVDLPITEKMLAQVKPGMPVEIGGAALGTEKIPALLSRLSPFLAAGSFTTTAEVDLPNPDGRLLPGMFVTADIAHGQSQQATLVPVSALWEDPRSGTLGVYVVDRAPATGAGAAPASNDSAESGPHLARLQPVTIAAEGRAVAGVLGVAPGAWVVTIGQHLLATEPLDRQGAVRARVRPAVWDRVIELQSRQHEHLLARFLEKQQRLARTVGMVPPGTESLVGQEHASAPLDQPVPRDPVAAPRDPTGAPAAAPRPATP
jgi:HlyD family secretion protein